MNNPNVDVSKKIRFPSLKKSEISKLSKDIAMDKVFCSSYIPDSEKESLLGIVFMPLLFGATNDLSKEQIEDIGFIYEYYNKAGTQSINGYPIFYSCGFVSKTDAKRISDKVIKIKKLIDEA